MHSVFWITNFSLFQLEQFLSFLEIHDLCTLKSYRPVIGQFFIECPSIGFVWLNCILLISSGYIFDRRNAEEMLWSSQCMLRGGTWFHFIPLLIIFTFITWLNWYLSVFSMIVTIFLLKLFCEDILWNYVNNLIYIYLQFMYVYISIHLWFPIIISDHNLLVYNFFYNYDRLPFHFVDCFLNCA